MRSDRFARVTAPIKYSVVIPVYNNAGSIPELVYRLDEISTSLGDRMEAVFVVDGSPDNSYDVIAEMTSEMSFDVQLMRHSRNFGSFAAIRTGLRAARGDFMAVMAADLQEPPELVLEFFRLLAGDFADVTVGRREARDDPALSRWSSGMFWRIYRRTVFPDMPEGGVDIFACTRAVMEEITALPEAHSSLVGLLYWIGYRRLEVPYQRRKREHGESGWSFRKKVRYLSDSVFSFTDLPLTVLTTVGVVGGIATVVAALAVIASFLVGGIRAPGYTPLMLVILFSTFSLLVALGIVGSYVWRTFENTKQRPGSIVMARSIQTPEGRVVSEAVLHDRINA